MNWIKTLNHFEAIIEGKLRQFFLEAKSKAKEFHPFIEKAYSNTEEFVLRKGKRIASCTTLLTYKGYTGKIDERILEACVGIELFRHSILIHDDIVDEDVNRRGGKTLHAMFTDNDIRLGRGIGVFLGDLIFAQAQQSIINLDFTNEKIVKALSLLSEGFCEVNESQMLDLVFEYNEPDIGEWYTMASRRAASLFKTTMLMGAILGDAPKRDYGVLEEAAKNMGYSFDIQDDIIDTFASSEEYGRSPGGDIALGKKPLHLIYALKLSNRDQLNKLKKLLGARLLSFESLNWIRRVMVESGALEAAKERSKKHAVKAIDLLAETGLDEDAKELLSNTITYIAESLDWYK